tara:strand:+ start:1407 stop:1571 length:165 start_codon:yes stop_codon:yes gene_type:complete
VSADDFRLAIFNTITLGISFTAIEDGLKIVLLLASIVYTVQKIYQTHKKKGEKN